MTRDEVLREYDLVPVDVVDRWGSGEGEYFRCGRLLSAQETREVARALAATRL